MFQYKRILLKLSGEALMDERGFGISPATLKDIVQEVSEVRQSGIEIAIVIGGGNIFRGAFLAGTGMDRVTADYMGMLATVMNAMALQEAMRAVGMSAQVMSALNIGAVVQSYVRGKAINYLEAGSVVVFAAGTGNPFFTTDTAAALRGIEIGADVVLKATKVDGVYSKDPVLDSSAKMYETLNFGEALSKDLKVMDATALALCRDQKMPVVVFSIFKKGALSAIVRGEKEGTLLHF